MLKRNAVFIISLVIVSPFVAMGIAAPEQLATVSGAMHSFIIEHFGWGYLLAAFSFLVFSLFLALSRYGKLKLGKDYEKPQYSYFGWFSMLFAAGMGIGLIFWGVAEPLHHFAEPPVGVPDKTPEAARFAMQHNLL